MKYLAGPIGLSVACFALLNGCGGSSTTGNGSTDTGGGGGSTASGGSPSGGAPSSGGNSSTGGIASGGASAIGGAGGQPPYAVWQACSTDEDCVTVPQDTCCGCQPFGVNVLYEDDARAEFARFNAAECPPLGCPWQACPADPVPVCDNGSCSWQPGCSARPEVDCESDGQCEVYSGRACGTESSGFVICGKPQGACDDALTCGLAPYGQQFMFPNGCIPEGWATCPIACD